MGMRGRSRGGGAVEGAGAVSDGWGDKVGCLGAGRRVEELVSG